MFSQQKNSSGSAKDNAETIVASSLKVKGNFKGKGDIVVEGEVEGSLKTEGAVFVGDKAKITANIEAKTARIGGVITGNIKTKEHLEVVSSARLYGDIHCSSLSVEKGAQLNGKCVMDPTEESEKKERQGEYQANKAPKTSKRTK